MGESGHASETYSAMPQVQPLGIRMSETLAGKDGSPDAGHPTLKFIPGCREVMIAHCFIALACSEHPHLSA